MMNLVNLATSEAIESNTAAEKHLYQQQWIIRRFLSPKLTSLCRLPLELHVWTLDSLAALFSFFGRNEEAFSALEAAHTILQAAVKASLFSLFSTVSPLFPFTEFSELNLNPGEHDGISKQQQSLKDYAVFLQHRAIVLSRLSRRGEALEAALVALETAHLPSPFFNKILLELASSFFCLGRPFRASFFCDTLV